MKKVAIFGTLLLLPLFSFAYNDQTTHPALTDETVDLFNLYYPGLKLSDAEKELIKQGSTDEDIELRPMHHFYDPVYLKGLWGNSTAKDWAVNTFAQAVIDPGYTSGSALASVSTHYFDSRTDFSWDRAVYDYVWHDKARGLKALGHVLHLIEDMSVPDHTRNDAHPPYADTLFQQASPYEHWTGRFTSSALDGLGMALYRDSTLPPQTSSGLQGYFDSLAKYSNHNFFSKDTVFATEYLNPKVVTKNLETLSDGNIYEFGYGNIDTQKNRLVLLGLRKLGSTESHISIQDKDDLILKNYWSRLSKQSVLHGVGVVKLFFEAVKKERATKKLLARNTTIYESLASALGFGGEEPKPLIADIPANAFDIHLAVSPPSESPGSSTSDVSGDLTSDVFPPGGDIPTEIVALNLQEQTALNSDGHILGAFTESVPLPQTNAQAFASGLPSPGFGGGAPAAANDQFSIFNFQTSEKPPGETLSILVNEGGGEADATSTASSTPAVPEVLLPLPDLTPPDISFEINECGGSVSLDGCLLLDAGTATLAWGSDAEDLEKFNIDCASRSSTSDVFQLDCANFDADLASTTATSTIYILPTGNAVYKFTAKAINKAGNKSDEKIITLESKEVKGTVVINEVAWRGTIANANDEWIELYNPTNNIISLAGWTLYAEDVRPYIPLSGAIQPYGYYLLERKDDNAVSDVPADLIYGNDGADWALNNEGEILTLDYASTTADKTARCQQRSTFWCSSPFASGNPSMERIDFEISGDDSANWGTADSIRANGLDMNGGKIIGTPNARNSLHYFISVSPTLERDKILKAFFKEYIVQAGRTLTIPAGKTLTVEPGVNVLIGNESEIEISGTLKAIGTYSEKITFTSLIANSLWKNIRIMAESAGSVISNTVFEYGGRYFNNTSLGQRSMLSILNNSASVSDSIFKNSYGAGLKLTLSNSEVLRNEFSVGTSTRNTGMSVSGGAPKVLNNVFSDNYQGLWIEGGSRANVENNTFHDNFDYAIFSINNAVSFKDNSGEKNGKNGITLIDTIALPGEATVLYQNSLPYLLRERPSYSAKVPVDTSLIIEPGTVFKGADSKARIEIFGNLELRGDTKDSILFTSLADDGVVASSTLSAGAWEGLYVGADGYVYGGGFTLRYGGGRMRCGDCTGFVADGGRVELSNGAIENNYRKGMLFRNSSSTLSNFEFRDHQMPNNDSTALISTDSTLILENLLFENNLTNTFPEGLY